MDSAEAHSHEAHSHEALMTKVKPLPDPGTPPTQRDLPRGRYVTDEFKPSVSFSVGKGWAINNPEHEDHFSIYSRDLAKSNREAGAVLTFVNVKALFDPQMPTEGNVRSVPSDLVAWFQRHPRLDISKPAPTTIGGVSAEWFDATASSLPEERSHECLECLPVFSLQDGEPISIVKGFGQRIIVVEGLDGETVAIILYAPLDQLERYIPKAQEVLDTVEWKAA